MLEQSLLLTDVYELPMLEAYMAHSMSGTAVSELFFRKLQPERGAAIVAALAPRLAADIPVEISPGIHQMTAQMDRTMAPDRVP